MEHVVGIDVAKAMLDFAKAIGRLAETDALAAGKPFKVAATVCIRKRLTILNGMLKHNRPWDAQHA